MVNGKDIQDYILSDRRRKAKATLHSMCRQSGSLLLTGGAIVSNGQGTLIVGPGTDNMLEATYQFPDQVEGIIGNGRAILLDTKENALYSVHFQDEIEEYFDEEYTKRSHKHLMSAECSNKIVIMNLEPRKEGIADKYDFKYVTEPEIGKDIRINPPSKRRKRIRNFSSKASYARKNFDIYLSWKEVIPMTFDDIYEQMKNTDMTYYTVVTPLYTGKAAWKYVEMKRGILLNPHEPILGKLLEEKVIG